MATRETKVSILRNVNSSTLLVLLLFIFCMLYNWDDSEGLASEGCMVCKTPGYLSLGQQNSKNATHSILKNSKYSFFSQVS